MNDKQKGEHMVVHQIRIGGVKDEWPLEAMRKVDRHKLVPSEVRHLAYQDRPLPIGFGQTISQPIWLLIWLIHPSRGKFQSTWNRDRFGISGSRSCWNCGWGLYGRIVEDLGKRAANDLRDMGYQNIHFKIGDGYYGWQEHAPYDAIIVTAASEQVPPPLLKQLKDGGRMIIPVGSPFMTAATGNCRKERQKDTKS